MMAKRTNIDRRAFVCGAGGVAPSLPLPECMAKDVPTRFPTINSVAAFLP